MAHFTRHGQAIRDRRRLRATGFMKARRRLYSIVPENLLPLVVASACCHRDTVYAAVLPPNVLVAVRYVSMVSKLCFI